MNDKSAIPAYRRCLENLGRKLLAGVIRVGRRSVQENVHNVEAFGVPHNC
jgi:hypothetical protein